MLNKMSSLPQSQPILERQNAVELQDVQSYSDLKDLVWENPSKVKVIKAGASWCAPCNKVAPDYVKLASENADVSFYTLDVSDKANADKWQTFAAIGGKKIPYFAIYKNHERVAGIQTSDIGKVKHIINTHTGKSDQNEEDIEPILKEDIDRFVLFPIQNKPIWDMYKKHRIDVLDGRRTRLGKGSSRL
jgi:thiol-disulfide isomerase/thioredoxin